VVNRVHPPVEGDTAPRDLGPGKIDGRHLLAWLGERDRRSVAELRSLLGGSHPLVELPLLEGEPTDLAALAALGELFQERLENPG
jgi:hypothetical protein